MFKMIVPMCKNCNVELENKNDDGLMVCPKCRDLFQFPVFNTEEDKETKRKYLLRAGYDPDTLEKIKK